MQIVGIIGGSGFIGSYITKVFLEEDYHVRVSTTEIKNSKKYDHLFRLDNSGNLEVRELDVCNQKQLDKFVKGCNVIVHAGTPFKLEVTDPQKELYIPTITGTRNLLRAIKNSDSLTRVIFLASIAAWNTSFPLTPPIYHANHIFSEADTPYFSENDHPYAQAKFLANKEVNKYIQKHRDLKFEIVSLSPVMVVGNSLSARIDSTSLGMQNLIKNKIAPNAFVEMLFKTNCMFAMVDVRDVAEAVFSVATSAGNHGKNYLIANESYSISDMSLMLNKAEPLNVPVILYDSTLAKTDLGIAFISAKESLQHCV